MNSRIVILSAIATSLIFLLAGEAITKAPDPWILRGVAPLAYEIGVDHAQSASGTGPGSEFLRNIDGKSGAWAVLMQELPADAWRGKRLRVQLQVKTHDATQGVRLWMRVDGADWRRVASADGEWLEVTGSTDWRPQAMVLDMPVEAKKVLFGVMNRGRGQVWLDDVRVDTVGTEVPVNMTVSPADRLQQRGAGL